MTSDVEKDIKLTNVGDRTRMFLLATHAFGLCIVSFCFLFDWWNGQLETAKAYGPVAEQPLMCAFWITGPLIGGLLTLSGVALRSWRLQALGAAYTLLWYCAQVAIFISAFANDNLKLVGPTSVYAFVLFPVTILHLIAIVNQHQIESDG